MAATLLLLFSLQIFITAILGGVMPPFSDTIGKVTPVKPKPMSSLTSRESSIIKSSLPFDTKDIIPKLLPSVEGKSSIHEFSSRLELTSSSRPLPVPKIDTSIFNEKFAARLKKKSSTSKVKSPPLISSSSSPITGKYRSDTRLPEIVAPLSPNVFTNSPNSLPEFYPSDVYLASSNRLSPPPNIQSLSTVPLDPFVRGVDSLSLVPITTLPNVTPCSTLLDPSTPLWKARQLLSRELSIHDTLYNANVSPLSSSYSVPYPLYYQSMYLPSVRTPEAECFYYPPPYLIPSMGVQGPFIPPSLVPTAVTNPASNLNSAPIVNGPMATPYLNPIKTGEISNSINTIPDLVPISNSQIKNPWVPLNSDPNINSIRAQSLLSSSDLRDSPYSKPLLTSVPNIAEVPFDISSTVMPKVPLTPPKISTALKPTILPLPPTCLRNPSSPLISISPSRSFEPSDVNVFPNHISGFDITIDGSRNLHIPDIIPIIETTDNVNTDDIIKNLQARINFNQISIPEVLYNPILPEISASQYLPLPNKHIIDVFEIPTVTNCPSRIAQIPMSYANASPQSPVSQCTSNMVSSINDIVSNVAQNIISPLKSDFVSNICIHENPYASILPLLNSPPNTVPSHVYSPLIESLSVSTLETPVQILPMSTLQPLAASIVPLVSPISLSPPQFCPTFLPSPALPSYTTVSSPFHMEPPVLKMSSSNKDTKDVEKMLELMLLAEILNSDDNFEWDDLDTLLAYLSVS